MTIKGCSILTALLILSGLAASQISKSGRTIPEDVSIIQLIGSPDRFDGRIVRAVGFLHLQFEGNALYIHSEDFEHQIYKNAIWLSADPGLLEEAEKLNGQYVIVTGTFSASNRGHRSMTSGALIGIREIDSWPGLYTRIKAPQ
jgi:hypothetical protein